MPYNAKKAPIQNGGSKGSKCTPDNPRSFKFLVPFCRCALLLLPPGIGYCSRYQLGLTSLWACFSLTTTCPLCRSNPVNSLWFVLMKLASHLTLLSCQS